ncbi:MAG: invasion associated locus B family protein [Rhodobacteraceae bacterium]|nr:invasion associated locus B family protein [Paracoccaceae bacterium]
MTLRHSLLPLLVTLATAMPTWAQEAAQPAADPAAPAAEAAPAAPAADGVGQAYVAKTFGDWDLRCIRTADGADPCQLHQLLKEKDSEEPVAQITIVGLPEGGEAVAGANIVVPLETLLTQQLNITVDGGETRRFPFTYCSEAGCVARAGFTKADIDAFRKGKVATISVVPVIAPDRLVNIDVSLAGFTAGFDSITETAPKN